ncbi:LysM peptidoglycan-binding domain-containing protein [Micromonospora sp. ALFpr18c]|uniref:BTAD domain-containing putative transcriptional regulator n=1 Tax=Micromonospora sp. ALFpr18c TaxID=1458665 RepID=UPI00124B6D30|nr:BTAD domain-containing putative transcriptional regulator [Micromonospora sp. ALFpr18c]KAB1935478.1 LysM peptidoglycan-binding domain-containing protein [Micromonospora sp. ALFpr18c]
MSTRSTRTAAITTSILSTATVPVVLAGTGVWTPTLPSPAVFRQWVAQPMTSDFLLALTVAAAAALWLLLFTTILLRAYSAVARCLSGVPALHVPGPVQGITAALLGATAVTTAASAAHAAPPSTTVGDINDDHSARPSGTPVPRPNAPDAGTPDGVYTVRRGDTLSAIAHRCLGDANRWPEIFTLNRGTHFPQVGGTLRDPDLIHPGWALRLPADATSTPASPTSPTDPPGRGTAPPSTPAPPPPVQPPTPAPHHRDDGIAPGARETTGTTTPGDQASTSRASTTPTHHEASDEPDRPTPRPDRGVTLDTGSWLDAGLVTAILAAVALIWAHRRHRYTRRPVSADPCLDDPDLAPMPAVIHQIRRRTITARRHGEQPATTDLTDDGVEHSERHNHDNPDPVEPDDEDESGTPPSVAECGPRPLVPSVAHPLAVVWPPAGLGLTGPGAEAAARGFMAAALAAGGLDAPDDRTWLVMPSATTAALLGAGAVALPRTPRLTVTAGLDEALDLLDAQTLHRSRIVDAHEVDTVAEARAADPTEEPMPPVLLLADADTSHQRTRIAALLAQGQRLDIHGLLLGAWPDGDTVVVAADGTTSRARGEGSRHGGHPADIGRLAVLTPSETSDLLVTLAESHTGQPQAPAPTEPARATTAAPDTQPPPGTESASPDAAFREGEHLPASNPTPVTAAPETTPDSADRENIPAAQADSPTDAHALGRGIPSDSATTPAVDEPDTGGAADSSEETSHGRVQVAVLGAAAIVDVPPGPTLRKKSLELLVYLAVHDGAASAEAILDDLLPDAPANKAPGRLYTYVSDLRTIMRRTAGRGTYLTHPHQRYVLNRDAVDVDLWRMRAAIRDANQATDPAERLAALRRAVDTYQGHLADGADYEWIEPYREAVRQQALDAYLALVDALADNPAEQLTVLDAAIGHNPYAEELYQQAMRARAALGHLDAIRSLRRALTRALGEIDAEPSDDTITLADQLVAQVQRPAHRPDLRPATRPDDGAAA